MKVLGSSSALPPPLVSQGTMRLITSRKCWKECAVYSKMTHWASINRAGTLYYFFNSAKRFGIGQNRMDLELEDLGSNPSSCIQLRVWFWAGHFPALSFFFLIYKIKALDEITSMVSSSFKFYNLHWLFVFFSQCHFPHRHWWYGWPWTKILTMAVQTLKPWLWPHYYEVM